MEKKVKYWLIAIFLVTLAIRLILVFSLPNFTYDSYFHLRQVEHIASTGLPIYDDPLSYGGRNLFFLPGFHYFVAVFDLFLPLEFIAKIIPGVLLSLLTVAVYFLSKKVTKNVNGSLISAFIAGFLPILFNTNTFNPEPLFLLLLLINIYAFLNIKDKKFLSVYILSFLALTLTSSATAILLIGFGIYLLLSLLENKKVNRAEIELIVFSLFFFIWVQFLFYKRIFLTEGISFIWQNVPLQIIQQYFPQVSITKAIFLVSIIPFLAGIFVVYRSLFELKGQKSFLLISFGISTTILAWFRIIQFQLSLAFFGLILAILFASFYRDAMNYFNKTRLIKMKKFFVGGIIALLLLSLIYPAINNALKQNTPTDEQVEAFKWLNGNTPKNSKVAALLEEGHLITYYGQRQNFMDDHFSLIKNIEKRFGQLNSLFVTKFQTQALDISQEYEIDYLVVSPKATTKYKVNKLGYLSKSCFQKVYDVETKIYLIKCEIK